MLTIKICVTIEASTMDDDCNPGFLRGRNLDVCRSSPAPPPAD
jgi:hypothetical protein